MRNILTITAASFMIASTLPALASDDDYSCGRQAGAQQMSVQDIATKVTGMGYDVRKVEKDDGCYEVYVVDKSGARLELKIHPATGDVVKRERRS